MGDNPEFCNIFDIYGVKTLNLSEIFCNKFVIIYNCTLDKVGCYRYNKLWYVTSNLQNYDISWFL